MNKRNPPFGFHNTLHPTIRLLSPPDESSSKVEKDHFHGEHNLRSTGGESGSHRSEITHSTLTSTNNVHPPLSPLPCSHFGSLFRNNLPPMPPALAMKISGFGTPNGTNVASIRRPPSTGDVKVILCVTASSNDGFGKSDSGVLCTSSTPAVSIDHRRKQVTLNPPASCQRRLGYSVPKIFSFDAVFTQDDPLVEVCSVALTDAVFAVVHGMDGCVLSFGHPKTGKSKTMLGSDASVVSLGVIPCAIAWLYRLMEQKKEADKTSFSVRVSALEVFGQDEAFKDLLRGSFDDTKDCLSGPTPSSYLRKTYPDNHTMTASSVNTTVTAAARFIQAIDKLTEIRAPSAQHAAHLLDVAMTNRTNVSISHTLFTLHVYQYKVEKSGTEMEVLGGRSRLQLLHLGSGRYGSKGSLHSRSPSSTAVPMKGLSLSNIANVLLGLLTGQRHLPHRESAVTQMLREAMTGNHAKPCILVHASAQRQHFTETLQVIQLASRLHRLRRRRVGSSACGGSLTATTSETTSDSSASGRGFKPRLSLRPRLGRSSFGNSTTDYTSSSEQSCAGDTVIYVGETTSEAEGSLGSRGCADGSVIHSADELNVYTDSGKEEAFDQSRRHHAKSRIARSVSPSEKAETHRLSGLIKRVTPRTNATAWPRAAAVRKGKDLVSSKEETWVDGPKAIVAAAEQENATSTANHEHFSPLPTSPYLSLTRDTKSNMTVMETPPIPNEASNTEPVEVCTSIDEGVNGCRSGIPSSSVDNHCGEAKVEAESGSIHGGTDGECAVSGSGRSFRVLSDISEMTEETESGTTTTSSSLAGGGGCGDDNTLLDLAIQRSALENQEVIGDERNFSWQIGDTFFETSNISYMRSPAANFQPRHKTASQTTTLDPVTQISQSGNGKTVDSAFKEKATSTDSPILKHRTLSNNDHVRGSNTPGRSSCPRRPLKTSLVRVAEWVKDVSTDLGQVQDSQRGLPCRTPDGHISSSCHQSCSHRRHRRSGKSRHCRNHDHDRECSRSSNPSKMCTHSEAKSKCCCICYDGGRQVDTRQEHEQPIHDLYQDYMSRSDTRSNLPVLARFPQRQYPIPSTACAPLLSTFLQRTISFPWIPTPPSRSITAQSSPCQQQQSLSVSSSSSSPKCFWPDLHNYSPQATHCYPWSIHTSPILHTSMQAWSTHLQLPSTATSDIPQTNSQAPPPTGRQEGELADASTPTHITHESKSSKFFSIFCTLRRWHMRRKARRRKVDEGTVNPAAGKNSLPTSSSLPRTRTPSESLSAPSSDQGVDFKRYCQYRSASMSRQHPLQQPGQQLQGIFSSAVSSQIHPNLPAYRTSVRAVPMCHDNRGDRGSSGYGSIQHGVAGAGSEVSSAPTDSVDSCCSGGRHQLHPTQCSTGHYFLSPCQQPPAYSIPPEFPPREVFCNTPILF